MTATLLNACFQHSVIPDEWRKCSIYLVYKSGEASDPMNYRPIALLNTSYKIFTSLLNYRFSRLLENTKSFSCMQGGFRIGRTTFTKI